MKNGLSHCWKETGVFGSSSCVRLTDYVHCRNCPDYNEAGRSLLDREVPGELLKEWTENLTIPKETERPDTGSLIVFRIRQEWLALKTVLLQETTTIRPVHRVPMRTNDVFRGIVNINGELLLSVSLSDLLESASDESAETADSTVYERMLVIGKGAARFAFPVDEVLGIYRLSLHALEEPPSTMSKSPANLITGIFNVDQTKVGLLDDEKLIHSLERSVVG